MLFALPILIGLVVLPVDRRARYIGLEKDCSNRAIWLHDRIFEQKTPIDVAFIGSSHTSNGIMDDYLDSSYRDLKITNLGYCRLGRNLSYTIIKNVLAQKQTKYIVLEVREIENRKSHDVFPHMATTKDVLAAPLVVNVDLFSDYYNHLSYKLELTKESIFDMEKSFPLQETPYGFGTTSDTVNIEILKQQKKREPHRNFLTSFTYLYDMSFPRAYLKKIDALCKENNAELIFLYIPRYGAGLDQPLEYETYQRYGEVLMPPVEVFKNKNHWYDKSHLNKAGAKQLSEWLSEALRNKLD